MAPAHIDAARWRSDVGDLPGSRQTRHCRLCLHETCGDDEGHDRGHLFRDFNALAAISLKQALSTPSSKSRYVRRLFSRIADRYDLITVVLSYGLDRRWKRRLIEAARVGHGCRILDLATGTGDLAFLAAARGASVVGLDITWRMLELAAAKRRGDAPGFVRADMLELPFADESFDVITTGYGIRNVPDLGGALDEIARVVRPGGRFVSLDFDRPASPVIRSLYLGYLTLVGSILGLLLHGDPETYRYIPASLRQYPGSEQVARMLRARGFNQTDVIPVLGGLMAIHRALKSAPTPECEESPLRTQRS
jgi:demethylmenaquinone methyltransferase/2-methoxy-6-polyprenyl-1,4-benzoquinol methylase